MKKIICIILSVILLFSAALSSSVFANDIVLSNSESLNNAANWGTYNNKNVLNGWWGAPNTITHKGKTAIKINSMSSLVTATKLAVEKNSLYSVSFKYCGGTLTPKILKNVGISTVQNGELVYKTEGDIFSSGAIGETADWNTFTFEFNSGNNSELEFFVHPSASSTQYAANPLYLADFAIEKLEVNTDSSYLNKAENWGTYNGSNVLNGWWGAPSSVTYNGKSAIKINSMSSLVTATKIRVEENTNYSISFEHCGSVLGPKAFKTVGIATIQNGEIGYKASGDLYNSGSVGDSTDWSSVSFEFNSGDNTELQFFVIPSASSTQYAANPMYLANFNIQKIVAPPVQQIVPDNYFETPENWGVSVNLSTTRPCKNILIDGISDTTVATGKEVITWAKFSSEKETQNNNGSSLLINNPNQTSHIKLPDLKTNSTYKLKFAYKPVGGSASADVLKFVGIFDPEFTQSKITADSSLTYSDLKTGFIAVDAYSILTPSRYRFEDGVYKTNSKYGRLNANAYNENEWRFTEFYFSVKDGLSNLYLLISYTTEAGKLYVDGFELEEVESIPDSHLPGGFIESDAPKLDENGYRLIDMEKENIITSDAEYVKRLPSGGYGNNGATLYIPAFDHTVTADPTKVTALNFANIHSKRNDPYFRTAVEPNVGYCVTVRAKRTTDTETTAKLLLYGDWYGYYDNKLAGSYNYIEYSDMPLNEWAEYTFRFTTASNQAEIAFYFNVGEKYPELYIDEVQIEKSVPLYTGPQNKTVIDFELDKSYYSHLKSKYIDFKTTKGVDGKDTTAMYFKERPSSADSNATFTGWTTVSQMQDPLFTIPVTGNTYYKFSAWIKCNDSDMKFVNSAFTKSQILRVFADFRGSGVSRNGIRIDIPYTEMVGTDWTEYTIEFVTGPAQTTVTFAVNADSMHPSFWVDNVTFEKLPAGLIKETDLSYCEDMYNLVLESDYPISDSLNKKAVFEFDVAPSVQYTYGVTVSGSGTLTVAFDEKGTDVVKKYNIANSNKRVGGVALTDSERTKIYLIFEPKEKGVTYSDMHVFKTFSIVGNERSMGYSENINNRVEISYSNVPYVNADSFENILQNGDNGAYPQTGDNNGIFISLILIITSFASLLLLSKKQHSF